MTSGTTDNVLARLRAALAGRYQFDPAPGDPPPLIGEGGMAFVFRAHDIRHHRAVAIKALRPDLAAELGVERFLQEIQVAAQLQHPLILPLFDSGAVRLGHPERSEGPPELLYYVMPLVEGETLRQRLERERQLPVADALAIVRDVAEALDHAHAHDIVHRDIKPENIFLTAGHAVVADFGIARAVSVAGGPRITSQGMAIGTPEYMSPEQASGADELDGRSDLYSLGCVLYEMLSGQPPFTGRTPQAIVARHMSDQPPSLRVVRPTLPISMERAIETALDKVPADRFSTAGQFVTALRRAVGAKPKRRWPLVAAALVVVVPLAWLLLDRPSRDPLQRDWVLLGDFASPVADTSLAAMLRDLVEVELNQSRHLSAMPDQMVRQALRDAGMPETTTVTTERAREIAIRYSVRAVLSGRITSPSEGQYLAVLEAVDAGSGEPIYSTSGPIRIDSLAHGAERLARAMRAGLGERRRSIEANRPLYRVTTPSFEAFRLYRNALDLAVTGNLSGSNRLLHEALAIDTGFAGAWAALGMNHVSARNLDSAKLAFDQAQLRPERLTDAQRYRLDGDAAYALRHDLDGAIRAYTLFLNELPTSIGGRNNLALYLSSTGRYEDALAQVDSAIALNPFGADQAQIELLNRTALLISLGRIDDAGVSLRRLSGPFERYGKFQLAAATGDWAWADSVSRRPSDPAEPGFLSFMATTSGAGARAALGDAAGADRALAAAAEAAVGAGTRWYQRARLLLALAERRPVTWTIAADSTPAQAMVAGLAAVLAGDTTRARSLLQRLTSLDANARGALGAGPVLLESLLDQQAGRADSAARRLAPLAAAGEHDALSLDRVDSYWLRLAAAEAFRAGGQADSARHYLELALHPERMPPSHYALRGIIYPGAAAQLKALAVPGTGR